MRRALYIVAPELTPEVNARPGGQEEDGGGGGGGWLSCGGEWLGCGVARSVMRTPVAPPARRLARLEGARHRGMYAGAEMPRSRQKSRKSAADGEKHATHLVGGWGRGWGC